ncbi:hypothetical protein BGX26_004076 [Mortierella sp. AD094]|nr:hypothetical protein BGX26_004076 [Mortierella sp. AD094]
MSIQFGPDRLIINIDKNITRISHLNLKSVEYNADGDLVILKIQTEDPLLSTSILEPYYDPTPNSGKAKKITLFIKCDALFIEEQLKKFSEKNINTSHLPSEIAAKIRSMDSRSIKADASSASTGNNGTANRTSQENETLFLFPFKSSSKSKSIAIQSEDMSRLNEGEFLNDTLIEFGLKHVYANVETRNPDLADKTYIFNSFFYERLLTKSGKSIQYDSVKSWTNKIDLFSKKYIIIPIHEKYVYSWNHREIAVFMIHYGRFNHYTAFSLHWYLAIITNPGLLLKTTEDIEPSSSPQMSLSYLTFDSNVNIDAIASPSLSNGDSAKLPEELETKNLLRNESSISREAPSSPRRDDGPGSQKRKLRSTTPSIATPVDPEERSLRLYLQQELLARKNIERSVDSKDVPGKLAKCPQQENFCDCGLFLLHYAEVFLKHPGPMLNGIVNRGDDMNKYWSVGDLAQKREKYREIMISLTEQYKSYLFSQKQIEQIKEASQHSIHPLNNER